MLETKRLESERAPKRDRVIASKHRLSHVPVSELLRRRRARAVPHGRPQILQHILMRPSTIYSAPQIPLATP